jgi:hypothetical protein
MRATDFDYRCEANHLAANSSPRSITVNLGRSRPIDGVTSQLRHSPPVSAIAGTSGADTVGRVRRRPRLGGLLNFYERAT